MPVFRDSTGAFQVELERKDVDRLLKSGDHRYAASKAYDLDPKFRKYTDHIVQNAMNSEPDLLSDPTFPELVLNRFYYGDWERDKVDNITAEMSQQDKPKKQGFFSRVWDVASAPVDAAAGLGVKALGAVTGTDVSQTRDVQNLSENIRQTGDIAPVAGMMIGSAAGPLGSAAGGFAGEAVKQLTQAATGTNEKTPVQQVIDPLTEGVKAGTIDAAFGLVGKGAKLAAKTKPVQAVQQFLEEKIPSRLMNSGVLKPLGKEFDFGKNPGQAVADEKLVAPTRGALLTKITERKKTIATELDTLLQENSKGEAAKQINLLPAIAEPIKKAMFDARKRGEKQLYDSLVELQQGLTSEFAEQAGTIVPQGSRSLTVVPFGAWLEKRNIADAIRWTGQAFDKDLNQVKFQIFKNIKKELIKAVPKAESLLNRYAGMIGAENSLKRTITIVERQNIASLTQLGVGTALGAGSFASGDTGLEAAGKGIAAGLLTKGAGSTAAKTIAAQAIKKLPAGLVSALRNLAPAEKAALFQFLQSEE